MTVDSFEYRMVKFRNSRHILHFQVRNLVKQKLRQISKIWPDKIEILCCSLRISSHFPARTSGVDKFEKLKNFKLSRSRDIDLDRVSCIVITVFITHQPLSNAYHISY